MVLEINVSNDGKRGIEGQVTLSQSFCRYLGIAVEWYWDRTVSGSNGIGVDICMFCLLLLTSISFSSLFVPVRHNIAPPHTRTVPVCELERHVCEILFRSQTDPIDELDVAARGQGGIRGWQRKTRCGTVVRDCKPGPRNGGGGPQTISFVEREVGERREGAEGDGTLKLKLNS